MSKNRLDFQAQLSRHRHDVSAGYSASMSTGMIIPQYFDILGPGDSIYYRTHMFGRLQDVVTAFLGEIDIHIDYFFVPLQLIYTPFGQIFAQTDDFLSSLYSNMSAKDTFPTFTMATYKNTDAQSPDGVPQFECEGKKRMRILDAFNMNPYAVLHSTIASFSGYTKNANDISDTLCYNPPVAPWIPCAYHAIFQKYFRNDEVEKLKVTAYNVDSYYNSTNPVSDSNMFNLEWAQRPSDYFTKIRVSPIASAVNSLGQSQQFPDNGASLNADLLAKVNNFLGSGAFNNGNYLQYSKFENDTIQASTNAFNSASTFGSQDPDSNGDSYLSAANIRALFAVDKFSRIYGRADKTYDDQILAHFGIHIPHDVKHDITHLKHYRVVLQADPIYGTANTQNSGSDLTAANAKFIGTIGQVGGQGQVSFDSDEEKFTAPVHGVFMCVAYALTKPRYTETFSKLHLLNNRLSFPIPEYDKLGAQPVYGFEGSRYFLQPDDQYNHSFRSVRRGWQNRYNEFKEKYNRCSLIYEDPKQSWSPSDGVSNIYAPWIISHQPYYLDVDANAASKFVNPLKFFENPHALDTVMVRPYVSGWSNDWYKSPWLALQSDPILTDFMCYAKKVSWMSETGEPDL